MKHIALLSLLTPLLLVAETSSKKRVLIPLQSGASISFSINNSNDREFPCNNINISSNSQVVTIPQAQESPILNKLAELQQNIKGHIQEQSTNFFGRYKWQLLGIGLVASYGMLCYLIISGHYYLGDTQLWSSWRQDLPFDQLLSIPQQQLSQELVREIQRRYTTPGSINDLLQPLGKFMIAIEQEEEQLKWYQLVYSWLGYAQLPKLVPINKNRFGKITERLQRAAYYKNVFQSWASEYQLQQAERYGPRSPELPPVTEMAQLLQIEIAAQMADYWVKSVPAASLNQ